MNMGFYYWSFLNWVPLGIAYGVLLLVLWGIGRLMRGVKWRALLLLGVGLLFLALPVSEELWIAWSFGQACNEAGTFIYKKVQVEGFYDDTHSWSERRMTEVGETKYHFVEGREGNSYWRHERNGDQIRSFKIDRPTAKYHFKMTASHKPVTHGVVQHESIVLDTANGELMGRYTRYSRSAPWFFVGLGTADFSCDAPGRWPLTPGDFLIYQQVLEPIKK